MGKDQLNILIISDTHGDVSSFLEEVNQQKPDMMIHLGDYVDDAFLLKEKLNIPSYIVRGNNDYHNDETPYELITHIGNKKFFLTHGHRQNVYAGVNDLYRYGMRYVPDFILYGHTHCYCHKEEKGVVIINPGSPSLPRDGKASFVMLRLEKDQYQLQRIIL